jgi:hypothetical protein
MTPSEYLELNTIFPSLLDKLTHLRKIEIDGINWTLETTPEVRLSVRALLDRLSLDHLSVTFCKFSKLDHFTSLIPTTLKRLDVDIRYSGSGGDTIDEENKCLLAFPPKEPCRLEHLECGGSSPIPDWIVRSQQSIDISNVHTLHVVIHYEMPTNASRVLRRLGSSLEHLIITFMAGMSLFSPCCVQLVQGLRGRISWTSRYFMQPQYQNDIGCGHMDQYWTTIPQGSSVFHRGVGR